MQLSREYCIGLQSVNALPPVMYMYSSTSTFNRHLPISSRSVIMFCCVVHEVNQLILRLKQFDKGMRSISNMPYNFCWIPRVNELTRGAWHACNFFLIIFSNFFLSLLAVFFFFKWMLKTHICDNLIPRFISFRYIAECGLSGSNGHAHNLTIWMVTSDPNPCLLAHESCSNRIQQNGAWKGFGRVIKEKLVSVPQVRCWWLQVFNTYTLNYEDCLPVTRSNLNSTCDTCKLTLTS